LKTWKGIEGHYLKGISEKWLNYKLDIADYKHYSVTKFGTCGLEI